MRFIGSARSLSVYVTLLVISAIWFASAHANQDGATDGFILFSTDRDFADTTNPTSQEIYVMLPDGTHATRITDNAVNDNAPVWSHSKKIIAFHGGESGRPAEIFLMNLDGSERRLLASLGQAGAQFPSFSHNGNELCFNSMTTPREIYIVDVHGTGLTNLTNHPGDDLRCDWSPKGNNIVFTSNRHGNVELYVMNSDGSDPVRLTNSAGADTNADWSPNGDRIAFESNRDGNAEIYVMNADGSDPMRLTTFAGQDTKPAWSPTGDRIAFHRQIADHLQVYTMNADGTDVTQITFTATPQFSGFPSWGKWSTQQP